MAPKIDFGLAYATSKQQQRQFTMEAILASLTLAGILAYLWYVSLIKKRNAVIEALAGIDTQLKKRAEVLPTILAMAQTLSGHNTTLLAQICAEQSKLLAAYDDYDAAAVHQHLTQVDYLASQVAQLLRWLQSQPELQQEPLPVAIATYEASQVKIDTARRCYNAAVSELNGAVAIFPGALIARLASVTVMPFFEAFGSNNAKP